METRYKDPDTDLTLTFVFEDVLVQQLFRGFKYPLDAVVRPADEVGSTGYYYSVTPLGGNAWGKSGAHSPRLPKKDGETVEDGSLLLTAVYPADASIVTIDSTQIIVPSGITAGSPSVDGWDVSVTLSGGTHGEDYEVVCRETPTVGDPVDKHVLVRVRQGKGA